MPPRRPAQTRLERETRSLARRRSKVPRTPSMVQMESVECGAAALGIILGHYGRHVALEDLRQSCGVSRDGANARNLVEAAGTYGLEGRGSRMEIADLMRIDHPVIIFWAFQHFVVVNGFRRQGQRVRVLLNDPAGGPRTVSLAELDDNFTGVVLDFTPGADFRAGGHREPLLPALLARTTKSGRGLPLALTAALVLVIPGLATPLFSQYFVDRVFTGQQTMLLVPLLVGMGLSAAAIFVLSRVQNRFLRLVEIRTALVTTTRFFNHLLRLPMSFFLQRRVAELGRRVDSNAAVAQVLTRDLVLTLVNLALIVVYGATLLVQDLPLAVLAMLVALSNLGLLGLVLRHRVDASTALQAEEGQLAATTLQTLQSIETVKTAGTEHAVFVRWSGFMARVVTESQRLGRPTALLTVIPPLLATLNSGLVMMIGGLRVADGAISVGVLFAFQALLTSFSRPMTQLTNQAGRLQTMGAQLSRLQDAENYPRDAAFEVLSGRLDKATGHLSFAQVSYSFGPLTAPWITGLNFVVEPGMRVALVGASGSGKSTVGRLAAGLLTPSSGEILIDAVPRDRWSRQALAASVAYVDQHISLFEGSVRDNVCLWDADIPDEDIVSALADAELLDDISQRAGGTNALISEGGKNLSGGQRQRLELARALVQHPTLLILDEATSALDPITERLVMDNLRQRGCALVVIAHRLSTVRDADRILVFEQGHVVEQGRHDELMKRGGHYTALVASAEDRQELAA